MKLLIAALLAVFSTGAMAEWTYLTRNANETYDIYIDKATIRKQGNVAKMWGMQDFKSPKKQQNGTPCLSQKTLTEYDCVGVRDRLLTLTQFSDNMGKGRGTPVIFDEQKWRDIAFGTIGMVQWKAACKK